MSPARPSNLRIRHEVQFYSDDAAFANGFACVVQNFLGDGNLVIVVVVIATGAHLCDIASCLRKADVDVHGATEQGAYIALKSAAALSEFMDDGRPDPVRLSDCPHCWLLVIPRGLFD